MLSFWEEDALCAQDILIVGGGLLGLSTALSVKEKSPRARICVLERGIFPSGASTRNAGFACFAKAAELLEDIRLQGEEQAAKLVADRYAGLKLLRSRISDSAMEYEELGGYELIREEDKSIDKKDLDRLNELLSRHFETPIFRENNDRIAQLGFKGIKQVIVNPLEGQIHSGKLVSALWRLINALGIRVITGAEVTHIEETNNNVEVYVKHLYLNEEVKFTAGKVGICTNALSQALQSGQASTKPGRGQVLITEQMPGLSLKGSFHFDAGYYYFRNYENRLLFGGGRNLDFDTESTDRFGINKEIQNHLEKLLQEMILPGKKVKIAHRWSGIMGFNETKTPYAKAISNRIYAGFTCNGMGVALSSITGEKLADELALK